MKRSSFSFSIIITFFLLLSCGTENKPVYTLTTSVTGEGTISPSSGQFEEGETVTLTAAPSQHWVFNNWSGAVIGSSSTVTITMDSDKSVVGNFSERLYPLNITIEGEGTVEQEVIQSKSEHLFGTVIQLTANPSNGWKFVEWSGGVSSTDEVVTVTVDGEVNITVTFERIDYPLTITIEGEGTVEQEVVQAKTTDYPYETVVSLTATPADGWEFTGWGGDLSGTDNPERITIDDDKSVSASFEKIRIVTTADATEIWTNSAKSGGDMAVDGYLRGIVWSTSENPTLSNNIGSTSDRTGKGNFTSYITGLTPQTTYYVRAYATNASDTDYGEQRTFTTTNGRDIYTEVVDVTNPITGRTWMDRNLGASRAAESSIDAEAYGDLYQWGRLADGHQVRTSPTTTTLSSTDQPGHGSFIRSNNNPFDWRNPTNSNLWQGVNGINNPCPVGYRVPTVAEWVAEEQAWSNSDKNGAFNSVLKLPVAGFRSSISGSLFGIGSGGNYWSGSFSRSLFFLSSNAGMGSSDRASGLSVRCIKD